MGYGAASAAAILTGRTLGEGKEEKIQQTTFTFQVIFCIIGVCTGLVIFLSRGPAPTIDDTLTPEAAKLTSQFIAVLAMTSVGTCYQMAADCGICARRVQTQNLPCGNNMVFTWLICLPAAALSAFCLSPFAGGGVLLPENGPYWKMSGYFSARALGQSGGSKSHGMDRIGNIRAVAAWRWQVVRAAGDCLKLKWE